MLYPDFNDLIAFKDRKMDKASAASLAVSSATSGSRRSIFRGQGLEFDSVRQYVPGDDIRNIDWRVTARTGSPHLKVFEEERERNLVISVDMNAAMRFGTRRTFKSVQAAHIAAILGWRGIAHQDRVSACLFGDVPDGIQFFPATRTKKSFCQVLKTLSSPPVHHNQVKLEDVFLRLDQRVSSGSLLYSISDFGDINEDFPCHALSRLRKKCEIVFVAVNDRADKELCPFGSARFCRDDQDKFLINTNDAAGQKAYEAQWTKNRQVLREIAGKYKIPLIELTTESDPIQIWSGVACHGFGKARMQAKACAT